MLGDPRHPRQGQQGLGPTPTGRSRHREDKNQCPEELLRIFLHDSWGSRK